MFLWSISEWLASFVDVATTRHRPRVLYLHAFLHVRPALLLPLRFPINHTQAVVQLMGESDIATYKYDEVCEYVGEDEDNFF